ncbi:MAG: diguanylate cyclase [Acidimicrobiia bacterium]|nr:diguanylate cyclase [Acidimicrobiia bacterium]
MKILLVDDSPTVRAAMRGFIARMGHSVVESGDGLDALVKFREERPDLVLIDVVMPVMDGFEAARRMRDVQADEWVPIIFLSARESDQDLDRGIEAGGDDYLVKPVSFAVLNAKIRAMRRIEAMRSRLVELSRELAAANQELERLSKQDGLTGIANRRSFDDYLQTELRRVTRERIPLALILVDVDHFKSYNDCYGHSSGDECLRQIAAALATAGRRPGDLPARYGGEEFAMVLPGTTLEGARDVACSIARLVEQANITHERAPRYGRVTVSQGLTAFVPTLATRPQDLVDLADRALYEAKQQGRNRFVALEPDAAAARD